MGRLAVGLAAVTLAGMAGTCAQAASPGVKDAAVRGDADLAQPAPVPGTFDFQLAQLGAAHAGAAAAPAPTAAAFDAARPDVAVSRRIVDAAWAFETYTRKAAALDGAFSDGAGVSRAVATSAAYEPSQLAQGAVAWGALAAMQDAGFVDAVRAAAPDAAGRDTLAAELLARPAAVLRLPGAREAAAHVGELVGRRGQALVEAGAAVNKASYGVQKSAWSKTSLDKPADRLLAVKTLGARRAEAGDADAAELMKAVTALRPGAAQSRPVAEDWRPTPAVARSVALAALALLGRAGEDHAAELTPLLTTGQGEDCLKMAKLNLHQCLAVAGPRYEDMFCLGRHAVADTGQCLVSTAGWTPAPAPAPRLIAAAAVGPARVVTPPPAPVIVPIALAALDGPERSAALATPAAEPAPAPIALAAAAPPPPATEDSPAAGRPRWDRPAVDADEDGPTPARYARRDDPPADRGDRLARDAQPDARADADEDDVPAVRAPRLAERRRSDDRYADARDDRRSADRYGAVDDRDAADDEDAPAPPRPAPYRWGAPPAYGPGYGGYGYGGYGGGWGYGPGGR